MSLKNHLLKITKNSKRLKSSHAKTEQVLTENKGLSYKHPKTIESDINKEYSDYVKEDKIFRRNLEKFLDNESPLLNEKEREAIIEPSCQIHDRSQAGYPPLFRGTKIDGNPIKYIIEQYKEILENSHFSSVDLKNLDPSLHRAATQFFVRAKKNIGDTKDLIEINKPNFLKTIKLKDRPPLTEIRQLSDLITGGPGQHQSYYNNSKVNNKSYEGKS